jgi:hypothetical protein
VLFNDPPINRANAIPQTALLFFMKSVEENKNLLGILTAADTAARKRHDDRTGMRIFVRRLRLGSEISAAGIEAKTIK